MSRFPRRALLTVLPCLILCGGVSPRLQSVGNAALRGEYGRAGAPPRPGRAPKKRALLVGVHDYERAGQGAQGWWNLHSNRDVEALSQVLKDRFGFDGDGEIKLLTTKQETTRESILQAFRSFLIEPTRPGDIVYFHYSGHGSQIQDDDGDELDRLDESLVPSDYVSRGDGSKNIRDDELRVLLEELRRRRPANVTLSFDCCYAGSNTRSGLALVRGGAGGGTRRPAAGAARRRGSEDDAGGIFKRGEAAAGGYVVISASRHDQVAKETYDDNGLQIGLLTYALVRALSEAGPQTTYRDLIERLLQEMLRESRQYPQLEGDLDTVLLQGTALSAQPYILTKAEGGDVVLQAGELQGMTKGSNFLIYPPETKDLARATPLAEAEIERLGLTTAILRPLKGVRSPEHLDGGRAVEVLHAYGDNLLRVDARQVEGTGRGEQVLVELLKLPLVSVARGSGEVWDVRVCRGACAPGAGGARGDGRAPFVLERRDGSVILRADDDAALVGKIGVALAGESRWRFIRALENRDPDSTVKIELRVVPVEVSTSGESLVVRGDKVNGWGRAEGGLKTLSVGDYVMLELRNAGAEDAYVTVLDLRGDGSVGPLWPDPAYKSQDNKVPADGRWHRVPDPFIFVIDAAYDIEIFKAIATSEPADFSPLLDPRRATRAAETFVARSPLGRLLLAATLGLRSSPQRLERTSWATSTVSFRAVARR